MRVEGPGGHRFSALAFEDSLLSYGLCVLLQSVPPPLCHIGKGKSSVDLFRSHECPGWAGGSQSLDETGKFLQGQSQGLPGLDMAPYPSIPHRILGLSISSWLASSVVPTLQAFCLRRCLEP